MPQLSTFCPISNNGSADWIPNDYFRCLWMDVNCTFYTDLTMERNSEELPQLLNIGSCGLHIVHGGLQKGVNESGWKLGHLMRSLWQLFHDTPARREDFVKLTGPTVFPLKFFPHRWVEDVVVAEWAHQMWPNIKKYVLSFRAPPKKAPKTASYATTPVQIQGVLSPDEAGPCSRFPGVHS